MEHQTFWKPEKKVKEPKQWKSGQKPKKEVPEWKKDILSHHTSNPSRADRAEFPRSVIEELIIETSGLCQCGCGLPASSTHHVMPRGRNGRGVKKNAMRTNDICHIRIQTNEEELQCWISEWERKFGTNFWFDDLDWEEFNRKQAAIDEVEQSKQKHTEQLEPIIELLTVASGRTLKVKELKLLDVMNESQLATFAKLMQDVIGVAIVPENKIPFGYGYFND